MLCIDNRNTNPYFNLAAEEYVLKHKTDDCFMLWRNENTIVVGKHQNTLSEINLNYVEEKNINVVRRLSGGGAVFHDLGNINFTFIINGEDGNLVDFRKFTKPVLDVLAGMGIAARFEGRNDLTIEGKKFSGNAEHVFKKRVLHHGTILFSSVMMDLSKALRVNPLKFKDKAVKSIRSRVTNIGEHLKEPMSVDEFQSRVMAHVTNLYAESRSYDFTKKDIAEINKLVEERYATWEWNYGYSPKYNFEKLIKTEGGHLEFHLEVERGIIKKARIFGDYFNKRETAEVEEMLTGMQHDIATAREKFKEVKINEYFHQVTHEEFISGLF